MGLAMTGEASLLAADMTATAGGGGGGYTMSKSQKTTSKSTETGKPVLQTIQHEVAEVVQGVGPGLHSACTGPSLLQ